MLMLPKVLMHEQVDDTLRLFRQTLVQVGRDASAAATASLVVDGSALEAFDSSALAVLLACRRMANGYGKSFAVQSLPEELMALAKLYGIESLLAAEQA